MNRILGASLLAGTTALLAACSGSTPTSARNLDNQDPRRVCSGYVIFTGECVECPNAECTAPSQT
jgi:hypothetical protein